MADMQEKQARFQLEAQKLQADQQIRMAELSLKREELALKRLELEQKAKQADEDRELKLIEIASKAPAPLPPTVIEPEIIDAEDAYPEQYPEMPEMAGMGGEMLPDQLSDDSLPPDSGLGPIEGMTDD